MQKRILIVVFACLLFVRSMGQSSRMDTMAVFLLDRMSETIGQLSSCSVTVKANYDISNQELGLVKHANEHRIYMRGSNRLLVKSEGDKGRKELVYNGKTLTHYSMEKNQYAQVPAASSTVEMIDAMNKNYGIEFPVADFLYPTFVDDILSSSSALLYLGMTKVNGKDCFHIAGAGKDMTFQFWIADDAFYLPAKMVIVYTTKEMNPQYEATFTDWNINPNLPDAIFEFKAPPKAAKIKMLPVKATAKK